MAKSKMDAGDQQLEMIGNYLIAFFKGVAAGVRKISKEQEKMVLFVIVALVSGALFYLRTNVVAYFLPEVGDGLHVAKMALCLAPVIPVLFLYAIGSDKQGNEDEFEKKFAQIKFCGKDGSYPKFKGKEQDGKKIIYSFYSPAIQLQDWRSRVTELENVLDCNIQKIKNAKKTKQIIRLHVVPSDQQISENLLWKHGYLKEKDFALCLGQVYA